MEMLIFCFGKLKKGGNFNEKEIGLTSVLHGAVRAGVGCGGGGNAYAGTTWELTRAEAYGVTMEGEMLDNTVGEMTIKFVDNSKMEINGMGMSGEATYTLEGDKIMVTEGSQTMEFTVANDEISVEASGATMYFTKK